jgi:uncharacterized radical SAM protein YgiQ
MKKFAQQPAFLPTTKKEMDHLGWARLDVILVSGDTYIDSPYVGVAVVGRVLLAAGYRVGIIAQPDIDSDRDIVRLGEPALFWGITAGSFDSMVANYTANGKWRKSDDMTPGGQNNRRPNRAVIAYSNLIRCNFKNTKPIVLGGIEASLRRISHYDAWSKKVRRSILFDAKADFLVYGMAEQAIVALADGLAKGKSIASARAIRGLCYISREIPEPDPAFGAPDIALADHNVVAGNSDAYIEIFKDFYKNADPYDARRLYQRQDTRFLVQNPPPLPLSGTKLDAVYELPFARDVHPFYKKDGPVKALDTIQFGLTTHRGCFGECRFCAIFVHQGRQVTSRSIESIVREADRFRHHPKFKGIISDVGGPTANMYGMDCSRKSATGTCAGKSCIFPKSCKHMTVNHGEQIRLLTALRKLEGVRKVFVSSGIRYDLILNDQKNGVAYLEEILRHHVSGQLKIAPEHIQDNVLKLMGKPDAATLEAFLDLFAKVKRKTGVNAFLTYYLMAAHPGCTRADMEKLRAFAKAKLKLLPEQVQIFTPTPSTWSTTIYFTEKDPSTGRKVFVEKDPRRKQAQKDVLKKRKRPSK